MKVVEAMMEVHVEKVFKGSALLVFSTANGVLRMAGKFFKG